MGGVLSQQVYSLQPGKWECAHYTYYSPMFFTMPTPTTLEIHLGTSYDFFLHNPSPRL
jgi:hypothetical protein